ncbi:MAG: hypothetical protein V8R14_00725 [Clostridia bacterium]
MIDPASDITFERVSALGDVEIDSSEEVLKRLSYMGNLNVKAYGIYINGEKVGSVENKKTAANVLQDIKDRYTSKREGAKIEEAVFIENVEAKQTNTELEDVLSEKEMVERLCTSGEKETMHKVVAGDTLADIAKIFRRRRRYTCGQSGRRQEEARSRQHSAGKTECTGAHSSDHRAGDI